MPSISTVSTVHVEKLGHDIEEIRVRTLDAIISKFNRNVGCTCDAVKKELIIKLFDWFTFNTVPCPEKVLDLLLILTKENNSSYLNAFGKLSFQNKLYELRSKVDPCLFDILNKIEESLLMSNKYVEQTNANMNKVQSWKGKNVDWDDYPEVIYDSRYNNEYSAHTHPSYNHTQLSVLDSTRFDSTMQLENETVVSNNLEEGIKWLIMPWQPIVHSDKGIFLNIEENLNKFNTDSDVLLHTFNFITNIVLQDFPAEVFLQRPAIVLILHKLLQLNEITSSTDKDKIIKAILNTLNKLTRSLRFRIYYYCDPCMANKRQKLLIRDQEYVNYPSSEDRDTPIGGLPEVNYNAYQSTGTSDRSHSIVDNVDESVLQLQQMSIPTYCIESLTHVITLLSIPNDPKMPLSTIKYVSDLAYELTQLLINSIIPTIWLCNDEIALKIQKDLKSFLELLGETIQYFGGYSTVDYARITFLHLICIAVKLLSNIVPLELADSVLPKSLKTSIYSTIMDAPIYLIYPALHATLLEYARQFRSADECKQLKLFDETRTVAKSMKAAIHIMKNPSTESPAKTLKTICNSKLSLPYHQNLDIIKFGVEFLRKLSEYKFNDEGIKTSIKLTLSLLANGNIDVQRTMYAESHSLVKAVLGVEYNVDKYSWENILFLFDHSVMTEIICHGPTNEDKEVQSMAEEILIFVLKGKIQMGEKGWNTFLEALLPCLPLLQCFAHFNTPLGKCITKMLDPDVSSDIQLPYIEVLKGNIRLLYSSDSEVRKEALHRLLWLLEKEKDSAKKLPRLSILHDFPLSSICIIDRETSVKRAEGNYSRSSFVSLLEILKTFNVEPKIKKSALVQISVMMTDTLLHKAFIQEDALPIILNIFSSAIIEKDYLNYADCVVPILTILKLICSTNSSVRRELSSKIDIYMNILRSLFLFRENECVKIDAAQLLCLFLYNDYMLKSGDESEQFNISLPHIIITLMKLPFKCKSHWKISINRCSDFSVLHSTNALVLTFLRQFWAWEWNDEIKMLWQSWDKLNDPRISDKLMIQESEFACIQYTSPYYYCQQQLYNIQNSINHSRVLCALDYLTMYLKLYNWLKYENFEDIHTLPWNQTFERFLITQPANTHDCDMSVNIFAFLYFYINSNQHEENAWLRKNIRSIKKSITDLLPTLEMNNENVHQWALKLARACSIVEENSMPEESKNVWIKLIDYIVANLCSGDQQHFYNLAYLDGLLACLMNLINKCQWQNQKSLLVCLGNALIELIISFHSEGTVRFMGLSITRNSIICLNQVLHQMQTNLDEKKWSQFWYGNRRLSWLPMLWRNRDPLVRASGFQVLAGLINNPHTAIQLLNALTITPNALCHTLLGCITNQEECCIVKEEACIALSNIVKNSGSLTYQYTDSLKANVLIIYAEQSNLYHEISILCSNCFSESALDLCSSDYRQIENITPQSKTSTTVSGMPQTVSQLYNCSNEAQHQSRNNDDDSYLQLIATPSLITAACTLLNNLIFVGQHEVVQQIYECSLDKHFSRCFNNIPKNIKDAKDLERYCDILEMNTHLCTVLTNCIIYCPKFASTAIFPPDILFGLFSYLTKDLYYTHTQRLEYLRNRLWTEIYKFLSMLSLTEHQHFDSIQVVLELCNPEMVLLSIYDAMQSTVLELQKNAIAFLAFLLSQDMQRNAQSEKNTFLRLILDKKNVEVPATVENVDLSELVANVNKLSLKDSNIIVRKPYQAQTYRVQNKRSENQLFVIGAQMCKILIRLYIAHNYAKSKKNCKQSKDKDLITAALTTLLCVSTMAKNLAIEENLPETLLLFLQEIYMKLNQQPFENFNRLTQHEKKTHQLFHDMNSIFVLLMNFMYQNTCVKEILAKAGLADSLHKLWSWICLNKNVLISSLKLMATFTTNCKEATQTLPLTTTTPGVGLRKAPSTVSLIHVLINLISTRIEKCVNGKTFQSETLDYSFHILRNAIHNHECRVAIVKSNLLQFFTKIHPMVTKRGNPWPLVELYCLEFLMDYTYYEEGQTSVPKASEGLDALIHLAKCSAHSTRILALSTLRNLAFNATNRPRLLFSVDFINLLHTSIKSNSVTEIGIASSALWSLISNYQKGKLIARNAGFPQSLQEALGKLTLAPSGKTKKEEELVKMLQYIIQIISSSENNDTR